MTHSMQPLPRRQVVSILGVCLAGLVASAAHASASDNTATIIDAIRKELRVANIRYDQLHALSGDAVSVHILETARFSDAVAVLSKLFANHSPVPGKTYAVVPGDGGEISTKPAQ